MSALGRTLPRLAILFAAATLLTFACGGDKFRSQNDSASGGSASTDGGTGTGGTSNGALDKVCSESQDCSDGDPCTVDLCGADSRCSSTAQSCGSLKCCAGSCGQCCSHDDCDDGVSCTDDRCFAGSCMHVPNNSNCESLHYCSPINDCMPQETCTTLDHCNDGDACSTDTCNGSLCEHAFCSGGLLCCPGGGCASCCADSNCDDGDPCTRDTCSNGTCTNSPLCGADQKCCRSADGKTATCGTCCSASECNDGISCTSDTCAAGSCSNIPGSCPTGQTCDLALGCVQATGCQTAADCGACEVCSNGQCMFGCVMGQRCCAGVGCRSCCQDSDCDDGVACTDNKCSNGSCSFVANNLNCSTGYTCDRAKGCIRCTTNADCNDNNACTADACVNNACSNSPIVCPSGQLCCAGKCQECCNDTHCSGIILYSEEDSGQAAAIPPPGECSYCDVATGKCVYTTNCCTGYEICPY